MKRADCPLFVMKAAVTATMITIVNAPGHWRFAGNHETIRTAQGKRRNDVAASLSPYS
jgi:hypothetical protein